ncbi:hypothetical protein [Arthrobacter bambusae]|uniref:Uncharacterized protein n=1 Tax=Arthrobacter bambusae TaxID=1338426 RepID=A0AAW8DFU8_9MICC|nr:hypothetical protein [Arthrobacter bambusae]MDP9904782.1 hypothetical protein [Arthrobacter bambusae]MDQ0129598.1 hypothetical protein [Arthrobacter bambusae]MDQ0180789.1 hypothetical protein [Arthrobacter bambusae]
MNRIYETATLTLVHAEATLPGGVTAAWDIKNLLTNAKTWIQTVGGLLLMLLGVAGLIWGGVLLIRKLWGGKQNGQGHGWGEILLLIIVGGALGTGGWTLISAVGSGGQTTIEQLGNGGTIIVQPWGDPSSTTGNPGVSGSPAR